MTKRIGQTHCNRCGHLLSPRTTAGICTLCAWRDRQARAKAHVAALRLGPCRDCGVQEPGRMDFDHVPERGPKLFEIGDAVHRGFSIRKLDTELLKCDLVCKACHVRRGQARGGGPGGLARIGSRNNARVTPAAVHEIRRRAALGETQTALAREHGVSQMQISRIVRRVDWSSI